MWEGLLMPDNNNHEETVLFKVEGEEVDNKARKVLTSVYQALKEKGYNPLNQLVGYLLSGDPAYITSHQNARSLIRQVERDELLEEIVGTYLELAEKKKL
jgi:uncharacterized protein (UPF0297 family)